MSTTVRGIALVLVLLACLLLSAPARLLVLLLPGEQLVMQGFSGSLWHGGASRVLLQAGPGYLHLGAVRWRLRPWSLLLLAPRLTLDSEWGNQRLQGELVVHGRQDIDLHRAEAKFAADLLRQFLPVALTGELSAQLEELQLRDGLPLAGAGRLVWHNGGWQSPGGLLPLGSYALDFSQAAGEPLAGDVLTLSGQVQAQGTVELGRQAYAIDITVSSAAPLDPQLKQALSLVASPEAGGYHLKLDGQL